MVYGAEGTFGLTYSSGSCAVPLASGSGKFPFWSAGEGEAGGETGCRQHCAPAQMSVSVCAFTVGSKC